MRAGALILVAQFRVDQDAKYTRASARQDLVTPVK